VCACERETKREKVRDREAEKERRSTARRARGGVGGGRKARKGWDSCKNPSTPTDPPPRPWLLSRSLARTSRRKGATRQDACILHLNTWADMIDPSSPHPPHPPHPPPPLPPPPNFPLSSSRFGLGTAISSWGGSILRLGSACSIARSKLFPSASTSSSSPRLRPCPCPSPSPFPFRVRVCVSVRTSIYPSVSSLQICLPASLCLIAFTTTYCTFHLHLSLQSALASPSPSPSHPPPPFLAPPFSS
jgi:hypothetical protein